MWKPRPPKLAPFTNSEDEAKADLYAEMSAQGSPNIEKPSRKMVKAVNQMSLNEFVIRLWDAAYRMWDREFGLLLAARGIPDERQCDGTPIFDMWVLNNISPGPKKPCYTYRRSMMRRVYKDLEQHGF